MYENYLVCTECEVGNQKFAIQSINQSINHSVSILSIWVSLFFSLSTCIDAKCRSSISLFEYNRLRLRTALTFSLGTGKYPMIQLGIRLWFPASKRTATNATSPKSANQVSVKKSKTASAARHRSRASSVLAQAAEQTSSKTHSRKLLGPFRPCEQVQST